jgi:predicted nucleotidyltransferase
MRVLAEQAAHPELVEAIRASMIAGRRSVFERALKRGVERGEIRPGYELDIVIQMLLGPVLIRMVLKGEDVPPSVPTKTVRQLLAGLTA